jgi:hypothetical protein
MSYTIGRTLSKNTISQLFNSNSAIAWFDHSSQDARAKLSLTAEAQFMVDEVVAALLVIEQDNRIAYGNYVNGFGNASAQSIPMILSGGTC